MNKLVQGQAMTLMLLCYYTKAFSTMHDVSMEIDLLVWTERGAIHYYNFDFKKGCLKADMLYANGTEHKGVYPDHNMLIVFENYASVSIDGVPGKRINVHKASDSEYQRVSELLSKVYAGEVHI